LIKNRFYPDRYNPELFDSLYHDFENYNGYIPIRDLAPLHNFDVSDRRRKVGFTEILEHTQEIMKKKP
jgi:hypothetical protein